VPVRKRWCSIPALAAVLLVSDAVADERSIEFSTDDNVTIAATVSEPRNVKGNTAAVIFIHQGGVRGHGESSGEADFSTLFDDPLQAPRDLAAAIDWLEQSARVDMSRVAIVGASIGANLACVAAGSRDFNIKSAVVSRCF